MSTHDLSRVILSHLSLAEKPKDGSRTSWIQLARTGSFVSNRYGKFSITKNDLSQMLHNFNDVTPKPTPGEGPQLPMDYDHLSMDPKKPGDGIAAGWIKAVELRAEGEELWGQVDWTDDAADRIEKKEYKFVSPSFVKDHTHKDGKKIGTTLLAAAITNHPFLEGMRALSLYNCSMVAELKFEKPEHYDLSAHEVFNLSEVGQRVMIAPGHARTMDETGGTFEIVEVVGQGDDAFVILKDANGVLHKWFRSTELLPASPTPMPAGPNLQPGVPNAQVPPAPGAPAHPEIAAQIEAAAAAAGQKAAELGASPEEQAAAAEAARQEATATAEAQAAATPNAAVAEGADPAAAAAAATAEGDKPTADEAAADGKQGGEGQPKGTAEETKPAAGEPTPAVAPAAGAVAVQKTVEVQKKTSENGAPDETDPLKKAVGALLGAKPPVKKVTNMSQKFMLKNDKNEEVEYTAEQLAAAGIRIVKDGETVIGTKELGDLNGKVTSLSSQVETLATATALSQKTAAKIELKSELDRLSNGGFILKTNRDYAEKKWGESTDLTDFKEWAGQFTTVIVNLNKEHGSGLDNAQPAGKEAAEKLLTLANTISRERGINLRDAMIQASAQLPEEAKAYREQFANVN